MSKSYKNIKKECKIIKEIHMGFPIRMLESQIKDLKKSISIAKQHKREVEEKCKDDLEEAHRQVTQDIDALKECEDALKILKKNK